MTGLLRALGAGVLLLALAACTQPDDDPEPIMPSESTSPPSPASSPTPERESAEAFVRRWIRLTTQMQNSGNTTELRAISEGCETCLSFADRVDGIYRRGGWVHTRGWIVTSIRPVDPSSNAPEVYVGLTSTPTVLRESRSSPRKRLPGGKFHYFFLLERRHGEWNMIEYSQESQ